MAIDLGKYVLGTLKSILLTGFNFYYDLKWDIFVPLQVDPKVSAWQPSDIKTKPSFFL